MITLYALWETNGYTAWFLRGVFTTASACLQVGLGLKQRRLYAAEISANTLLPINEENDPVDFESWQSRFGD